MSPRGGRDLHSVAVTGMFVFGSLVILSGLIFVTIGWPGITGRYVVAAGMGSMIGFVTCASAAMFTAARDTYPRRGRDDN